MAVQSNNKAWVLGIIIGILGIIISAAIYQWMIDVTGYILGVVAILVGIISGGMFGLGYKMGKGKIINQAHAKAFLLGATIFGLLGVLAAYFIPVLIFIKSPSLLGNFILTCRVYKMLIMADFNFLDLIFIIIGAWGGRWAGKKLGLSIVYDHIAEQSQTMLTKATSKKQRKTK